MSLLNEIAGFWMEGAVRTLEAFGKGFGSPASDPAPTTPYEVIYEGGKVRLRHYQPAERRHKTPLLIVYALIKRPFILDLQPGKSVIESLLKQGFEVYLIDWIPPNRDDAWRGFDAYVNGDVADAVRAVQLHEGVERVHLMGYCFGALLALLYTALHGENVKNLVTLTVPFDLGVRDLPIYNLIDFVSDDAVELVTRIYGNCPAWMMNSSFNLMAPMHHALDKYVGRYRNGEREGYAEMFELFERWMNSDVPLAGQIYREMHRELFKRNALVKGDFKVGGEPINLGRIVCPLLNVVAEHDDVVHQRSSLGLPDHIGSEDKRNITFPTGHIGAVVSGGAIGKLWPQVGQWLAERDE
ncbi:MAG TPA: alpha/beta fold hydrolase [Candidatus Binataceae bacterium]|nr:alpha/beta fold hydrolase [Candidatus Binataceae bacterium]